ncbi:hypothetical protein KJ966_27325 [bacterium]|nr:hypothetical protein [bacterium]
MDTSHIQFNERELKQVIFTAALMSSIDRDEHEKEWNIIKSFGKSHWKQEYGDFEEFQRSSLAEIRTLLEDDTSLFERIEMLITDFGAHYTSEQKNMVIDLLGAIMEADEVLDSDETNLFGTFLERLTGL